MLLLLDPYVDVILALALAYLSLLLVKALFGPLGGIPVVGSKIAALEHAISQSVANACGSVVRPVDVAVGKSLAGIAGLVNRVAGFVGDVGRVIFGTAETVAALVYAFSGVRALAHELHGAFRGIEHGVKTLEREFHGIEHRIKALEHDLTKGIGHDLRLALHQTEKEVAHIEHKALPAIRAADAQAESAISNLYDWAKGKADLIGIGTFAGAIAVALSALGLDWIKCKEGKNLYKQHGCGMWSLIGNLLGLAGFLTIAFDFREFVSASDTVASFIGTTVADFEGKFPVSLPALPPPE